MIKFCWIWWSIAIAYPPKFYPPIFCCNVVQRIPSSGFWLRLKAHRSFALMNININALMHMHMFIVRSIQMHQLVCAVNIILHDQCVGIFCILTVFICPYVNKYQWQI